MKKLQKGFTLIELLVVVAIIGILATVVLASLGQARSRAKDAAAKAALSQLRAEMELNAPSNATGYSTTAAGTTCIAAANKFITAASNNGAANANCSAMPTTYRAYVQLNNPSTPATYFCVDSTGYAGEQTATPLAQSCV